MDTGKTLTRWPVFVDHYNYCYRDPRTGKEFGLGRDRRIAITEAIQANIELFSGHKHKPLTARINSDNSVTLHSWLDRYEKI
ncbi:integrase, partial [Salmonella enterica subsp. enterica serovar Newport]|nr:integrase [Salmonella enterica subsp. enterica serovar Newport]